MDILLVEDDADYRQTMHELLEKEGYSVDSVENGLQGIEAMTKKHYVMIISDLEMEIMDGNRFLNFAKNTYPEMKTIILTGKPTDNSELEALANNVDYYLSKSTNSEILLEYIRRTFEMSSTGTDAVYYSREENLRLDVGQHIVEVDDSEVELTKKEFEILHYLLKNKGQAVSRETLIKELWDSRFEEVNERAIDVHIKAIRKKTKVSAIVSIRGYGYKWNE